ncbi:MAG: hypothetical protein ACREJD_10515 [Phycisphaerales bacterium]
MKVLPRNAAYKWLLVASFALPRAMCFAAPANVAASEQSVSAGPIQATLKLDRDSLNVAESLIATLTVRAPTGVRVTLAPAESKLAGFSVVSAVDEPLLTVPTAEGQQQLLVRRYTLEPFLPGEYKFPPIEIRWQKSAAESGVARTAEVKVAVASLLPKDVANDKKALDPGPIRDAYTPPVTRSNSSIWIGIAIGFAAASALGVGFWVLNGRAHTSDEVAQLLARIEALRASDQRSAPSSEAMHELATSLRSALANRVDPAAATADTSELVERLERRSGWGVAEAKHVGDILGAIDAARFGGIPMPSSEFRQHVDSVIGMLVRLRALPSAAVGVKQ